MKELQNIIAAYKQLTSDKRAALATLVKVEGSTYRRPGARMLIAQDGSFVGSISGGCLEGDVIEQALAVMHSGQSAVVKYDTTSEEDLVWGLGLGCQGIAHILIEPLNPEAFLPLTLIDKCFHTRSRGAIATVFHTEGQLNVQVGSNLLLYQEQLVNQIQELDLANALIGDVQTALSHQTSTVKTYRLTTGSAQVFIEVIAPPLSLLVFGAGRDAIPVVRFANQLGWQVTVVDSREREATRQRFQEAERILLCPPDQISDRLHFDNHTVAVVMTHNYFDDLEILKVLLPLRLSYLGILGPRKRTERLFEELRLSRASASQGIEDLYSPVGLDIGAEMADEIALSVIAEIQAVINQRQGGFLKNRSGSIHARRY